MARPAKPTPYVCGPYKHRAKHRLFVCTGRSNGRREGYHRSFDTREAAKVWQREFERQLAAAGRTVADAVIEYLAHLERKGNKATSIKTARYRLDAILDRALALVDLNQRRAQDMYDDLVDEGVAVDTHRGCLVAAKAFGRFCHDRSWLSVNPFAKVEPVGKKSRGKGQLRIDEGRKLITHCLKAWRDDKDRSAVAAMLPLLLNLRSSEVAQLTARDVDDKGRLLWIGETDSKTDAGRRRSLVPSVLIPVLLELAATPAAETGHLFARDSGEAADRHWVSYHARRHMAGAGIPVVTTHGLRGTHATFARVEGQTGAAVARAMGHEDEGMTDRHYLDRGAVADAHIQRVADAFVEESKEPG